MKLNKKTCTNKQKQTNIQKTKKKLIMNNIYDRIWQNTHKQSKKRSGKVRGSSGNELFHDLPGELKTLNPFLFNKTQPK